MFDGVEGKRDREKNKKIIVTVSLSLLVLIVLGFMAYNVFNFMIREEIIMSIEPSYQLLQLRFNDNYSLPLSLSVDNNWLCVADCTYTLTDISSGKILVSESLQVQNHKTIQISHDYIFSDKGYGQKMLQYLIECRNNPSKTCLSGNNTYRRIATFVINYSPSIPQEDMMSRINQKYTSAAASVYESGSIMDKALSIYNIPELKTDDLDDEKDNVESMLNSLTKDLYSVSNYWESDEYETAGEYFDKNSITKSANDLYEYSSYLLNTSISRVNSHNKIIMDQKNLIAQLLLLNDSVQQYPDNSGYSEFRKDVMLGVELVNLNTNKILTKDFSSYDEMQSSINNAGNVLYRISDDIDMKIQASKKDMLDIYLANALKCVIDGRDDCEKMTNLYNEFIEYDNYSIVLRCDLTNQALLGLDNITGHDNDINYSTIDEEYTTEQSLVMLSLIISYNESINNSIAREKVSGYYTKLYNNLPIKYEYIFLKNYYPQEYNKNSTKHYSSGILLLNESIESIHASCDRRQINIEVNPFEQSLISIPDSNIITNNNHSLPQPKRTCCIYGICTECCAGCIEQNPLIMLHGHSFNDKNSAYQSTEIFNAMEKQLVSEKRFVSIGIPGNILYDPEVMSWYDIPILMKPTYYVTSFNSALGITFSEGKSGNIDTYALRLKEDIDYIKSVTKKDKIDIITHSMGGLVVRRYIQIFGSDSINKLIMIGTPNNGIKDKQYGYCKLFGQINECDDMRSGSLFLNKLNDFKNQPKMPETYIIIGTGCDMDGEDGDGVVTVENAKISGYDPIIIKGTCHGTSLLHNEMLDINKYPEIYDNIIKIIYPQE